ncbi:MAG TPA: Rnf-Nqr domain containing protein [Steroidobacteraceae bacterium]|jgi:H+/Na+-translocating ferredoxin:NAD+ oxidoreductase subunit A|nr:Rnf-Nqr domain containing protein [Steroidobacteraceae bacterium]
MASLLLVLLSSVLVTTVVLAHLPQWRPFVAPTDVFGGARVIAILCLAAVPAVALLGWVLVRLVLGPWHLEYLRTPALVAIVLIVVPLADLALRRRGTLLTQQPGFALVMGTNTALLGIALITDMRAATFGAAILLAIAAAAALALLLLAFAALYERLQQADVPAVFREAPLALITAGIMALAFMGFSRLIQE